MSSTLVPPGECDRLRNNLRAYLVKWWKASDASDFDRFASKAKDTYLLFSVKCPGAVETYEKMFAEVTKLPKGAHIRDTEYMAKHHGRRPAPKVGKKKRGPKS